VIGQLSLGGRGGGGGYCSCRRILTWPRPMRPPSTNSSWRS